jgi:hypothetical protein
MKPNGEQLGSWRRKSGHTKHWPCSCRKKKSKKHLRGTGKEDLIPPAVALVLCTGVDKTLLQTRRLILKKAGHKVVTAMDENVLISVCQKRFL